MKQLSTEEDRREKNVQLAKKLRPIVNVLVAALFVLIAAIIFIGVTQNPEKDSPSTENENPQIQNQEKELQTDNDIKVQNGLSVAEKEYLQTVKPLAEIISKDIQSFFALWNAVDKKDDWLDQAHILANNIVENGRKLAEMEYSEDIKVLGDLACQFGYNASHAYSNYLEGESTGDIEKLESWKMNLNTAIAYSNELSFYSNHGFEISKQIEEDVKNCVGSANFNFAGLSSSGTNVAYINLKQELFNDKSVLKDQCLLLAYDIMKTFSEKPEYGYLDIIIKIHSDVIDEYGQAKELCIFNVELAADTRKKINFDNFSWSNIPNIADAYHYFYN